MSDANNIVIEAEGKTYTQKYLSSEKAIAVQMLCLKKGFMGLIELIRAMPSEGLNKDSVSNMDAEVMGGAMGAVSKIIQELTAEDISTLKRTFDEVTFIEVPAGDNKIQQRIDALKKHWSDARDVPRLYSYLAQSIYHQVMVPFISAQFINRFLS